MSEPLPKIDLPWTEDDTGPPLPFEDTDNSLAGGTVKLKIIRPGTATVLVKTVTAVFSADGQITDSGPPGKGQFTFVTGDLVPGLNQECAFEFIVGGVSEHTDRFLLDVVADPEGGA